MGAKSWSIDYSGVDWSESNAMIARKLGIDTSSAWSKRKKLGMSPSGRRSSGIEVLKSGAKIDWDNSIREKDTKGRTRTKIKICCAACKIWRFTNSINIGKIRKGQINYCQECVYNKRGQSSRSGQRGIKKTTYGYIRRHIKTFSKNEREILLPMLEKWSPVIGEHRAVMALTLGRPLLSSEIVHHLNGDKTDNRIENLRIISHAEHRREHAQIILELSLAQEKIKKLQDENKRLRQLLITAGESKC